MKNVPQRRTSFQVFARRSERTITTVLAGGVAVAGALFWLLLEFPDLSRIPVLGNIALIVFAVTVAVLVLLGIPYLAIKAVRSLGFRNAVAGRRADFEAWAPTVGWSHHRDLPHSPATAVMAALRRHDETLNLPLGDPEKARFADLAIGHFGGHQALVFSTRGLGAPIFHARLVALRSEHRLPPLSITDRASDQAWVSPSQQFESAHFNERWRVIAKDPRYASAMVHQQVIALLHGAPLHVERVDYADDWVVSWAAPDLGPEQLGAQLALLKRIAEEIPRYVLEDYR